MTNPFWADGQVTLHLGDCTEVLTGLADSSVDAVVTDPPYGLEFMGKEWDKFGKDTGNGYTEKPRWSNDSWDKGFHVPNHFEAGAPYQSWCQTWAAQCLRVLKPGGHLLAFGGTRTYHRLACAIEDAGFEIRDSIHWIYGSGFPKSLDVSKAIDTDLAREWAGWGTALKPAHEPIVVARKPLAGTVAASVLEHGTGALNVDACRVGTDTERGNRYNGKSPGGSHGDGLTGGPRTEPWNTPAGRWPPNVLLGPEAAEEMDRQSGVSTSSGGSGARSGKIAANIYEGGYAQNVPGANAGGLGDTGGASRFFPIFRYEPKAPAAERPRLPDGTVHPTVKPVDLMRWLVRLVTPPGGLVLDPFAGSGTTGEACVTEGLRCVLIERDPGSVQLCRQRLRKPIQPTMF